jgi:hypothetical protein
VPRSLKALLALIAALLTWSIAHAAVGYRLAVATGADGQLGLMEHTVVSADLLVLRWLPYAVLPVLLAPEVAIGVWALVANRAKYTPLQPRILRAHLRAWTAVLAGAVGLGAVALTWALWSGSDSFVPLGAVALVAFSWGYAGALWAALWLQKARNAAGLSNFSVSRMALVAFALAAFAPLHFFGAAILVWVLWASRGQTAG